MKLIQWEAERAGTEFDADVEEHMRWVYERALRRAELFGIQVCLHPNKFVVVHGAVDGGLCSSPPGCREACKRLFKIRLIQNSLMGITTQGEYLQVHNSPRCDCVLLYNAWLFAF